MKINKLIEGLDIIETNIKNFDEDIKDVAYNSKNVEDGFAFICIKGFKTDGHEYIDEAIKKGAKLIVVDEFFDTSKLKDKVLFIKTSNTRRALSVISANFFEHPSKNFLLIGVTGTNGKTSTTFMIKSILEQSGHKVGLIGTVKNMIGQKEIEAKHTTPESYDLQKLFFEMKKENVDSVVMEVSSHSLDLHRVDCCDFDVGVFTNLTQDHLDFHGTMENYFAAKLKLFKMSKKRVVNVDDEWGRKIVSIYPDSVTYGINLKADVCAMNVKLYVNKNQFELRQLDNDNKEQVTLNIPGLFSVYNALAAASCAYALGIDLKTIKMGLESVKAIPGRFEIVESNDKFTIVIDYAHTPDGLLNLMMTVDEVAKGRKVLLLAVEETGTGQKRPIMGEIAGKMADFVIVTSDNPRTEDPIRIIDDILVGLQKTNADYVIIPDRYEAIKYAIQNAKENDFIVLAGKGHETYQILKDRTIHFDEREVVRSILEELKKMSLWLSEIAETLHTNIENFKGDVLIESFSINSKSIGKNTLFIPLKGNKFDGHDFIQEAVRRGAISFITQKDVKIEKNCPYLKVEDTLKAMQILAKVYREKRKDLIVVGITGSVGKTTTKEYVFNVLNNKFKSYKNEGNFNNHIGLPYSILNIPDDAKMAILEMGMSNFGEISFLSKIAKPNIGIITNIGVAHIENLKTRYNIFLAKSEIQDGMPEDGILIVNNDNDILYSRKHELKRKVVTVGIENDADFRAKDIQKVDNGFFFVVSNHKYFIESFNFHDIYNSLFAIAVGEILGIAKEAIEKGILKKGGLKRRFEVIKKDGVTVVDDSYNASTHSMMSAIDGVCGFSGKKILVLGDMLELGEFSEQEHRKVGKYILSKPIDVVICTGKDAFYIFDEVRKNSSSIKAYYASKDECLNILKKEIEKETVVLFKASRGMKLDELVDNFLRGL